jgi:hypothetical protein
LFHDLSEEVRDALHAKHASVEKWLAIRKEEALKIDPDAVEVKSCDGLIFDPYGVSPDLRKGRPQVGLQYFARRPDSSVWVWFGDLPKEVCDAVYAKRKQEALKIDPDTAEVASWYGHKLDPYGVLLPPEEYWKCQRNYFARRPGSSVWVSFDDLPEEVCDGLYAKHAPFEKWLAIRKKEALKIDPDTAEVATFYGQFDDPYGVLGPPPEGYQILGKNHFARRPGSSVWVSFDDLPEEVCDALDAKHVSVEQWLAIRKKEALKIDPDTAEVKSCDAQTLDPYAVDTDLPAKSRQAGREYFACRPGSSVWVWFGDLPQEVRDALHAKHALILDQERRF